MLSDTPNALTPEQIAKDAEACKRLEEIAATRPSNEEAFPKENKPNYTRAQFVANIDTIRHTNKIPKNVMVSKRSQAEAYYQVQPFFFDQSRSFWLWNHERFCYEIKDDTDLLNGVADQGIDTIDNKTKSEILEALRQVGRQHIPKDIGKTWVQFYDTLYDIASDFEIKASPEYFVVNPIPHKPSHTEDTPIIDSILKSWVAPDKVQLLYEILAYSLLPSQPLERIFFMFGSGSNGKSRFQILLTKFAGVHNICSCDLELLTINRFESSNLHKKIVCLVGETDHRLLKNTNRLKQLTGSDLMRFERKGRDIVSDYNYAKIMIASNSAPETQDKTDGFYRRIILIRFQGKFTDAKDIIETIPQSEYNALARKSISILKRLIKERKFTNEGDIEYKRKCYEDASNPLDKYINEECETSDPDACYFSFQIKDDFRNWQVENGYRVWTESELCSALKSRNYENKKRPFNSSDGEKWYRAWLGLKRKEKISSTSSISSISHSVSRVGVRVGYPGNAGSAGSEKKETICEPANIQSGVHKVYTGILEFMQENKNEFGLTDERKILRLFSDCHEHLQYDTMLAVLNKMKSEGMIIESRPGFWQAI